MSEQAYLYRSIPLRLILEEPRLEGGDPALSQIYGRYVSIVAPTQLATANLSNPKIALGVLFGIFSLYDGKRYDPGFVAELIAVLKLTKAIKGKTLDSVLQAVRGEPVLVPVYQGQPPQQEQRGGILGRLRQWMR